MIVAVDGDRAVKLTGDREHPFTRGFLCQKVNRYLERVYHPERLTHPMRRVGPKGQGQFERINWADAIAMITKQFRNIAMSADGPQSILPYSYGGTMGELQGGSLDRRYFHRLGASLLDRTICASAGGAGCEITLGHRAFIDPETVIHAKLILNWGSNTAVTNSHLWTLMHQARKRGATIVTIDPYRSPTAAKSDWWIPIRPGTDAALALAMMHIIFRDGLQDQDYMDRYCFGGDQLRLRTLNNYAPDVVAKITSLPVADIERLAKMYSAIHPSFLRLNYGMQRHAGGGMAARTICCLPGIVGAWRHVGGGALLSTSKMYGFNRDALQRPDLIPPNTRTVNMSQLAQALNHELPGPPIRAIFVYNANPVTVNPDQNSVRRGFARQDLFTVVQDQFLTDTAKFADIVLPATTQLEHFDIHGSYGHLYVQTNEPAIPPLAECKPNTEVFRLLGTAMGFENELFAASDEELAREALVTPASTGRFPVSGVFDGLSRERLKIVGAIHINMKRDDAPFAHGGFDTPSGKCEFHSNRLEKSGIDPLPSYIPPAEDPLTKPELASRFPLQLVSPPHPAILNSTFANVKSLSEQAGQPVLELTAHDANTRGLNDGDMLRIFNDRGEFQARLKLSDAVKPGVAVTLGCRWGGNVNTTTSTALTDFGGGATFFDNMVQVEKAR